VSVPVRDASDWFAVTLTVTTPFPVPFAPLVIDIHPRSDAALHVQWLAAATFTELDPPEAGNESDDGESVYVHGSGVGSVGDLCPHAIGANPSAPITAR
jgi:hypothetical protein